MDMWDVSFAQQPTVPCPRCEQPCEPDVWLIVDGDARPELLAQLREGSLHALACPRCGEALGQAEAPLLLLRRRAAPPHPPRPRGGLPPRSPETALRRGRPSPAPSQPAMRRIP